MKKTLLYLQSIALTATPVLTVVACNKASTTKDKLNPSEGLSKQEKEIINNTSLFTKLLLLSRHENLNFNSTDLLNSVFAPKTTWNAFSRNYTVNGKTYNLNEYTEKLTTEYSNLAKLNATAFDPFLASTLTGMYDDSLYQNYVAQKFNKKEDIFGFFEEKDKFEAHDLNPIVKLANANDRKQLSWANFTGPLSKYIADKHILDYKHLDYNGEDARHFYGRFLDAAIKIKKLASENITTKAAKPETVNLEGIKIKDENFEIKEEFGKYQTKLFRNQMKANFSAKILEIIPFIQNFNETSSGSVYGLNLLNSLFPFTDTKSDMDITYVLFLLLDVSIKWMKSFSNKHKGNEKAVLISNKATEISGSCEIIPLCITSGGLFKELDSNFLLKLKNENNPDFKVQMLIDFLRYQVLNKY